MRELLIVLTKKRILALIVCPTELEELSRTFFLSPVLHPRTLRLTLFVKIYN
jgi:hypothetical protein